MEKHDIENVTNKITEELHDYKLKVEYFAYGWLWGWIITFITIMIAQFFMR